MPTFLAGPESGPLIGLLFGIGVVLIIWTFVRTAPPAPKQAKPTRKEKLEELIAQAGIEAVSPGQLIGLCIGVGSLFFFLMLVVTRAFTIPVPFALMAGYAPYALVKMRARSRRAELRELWPDVIDNLASSVRAGLSLAEALTQLGHRGPETLRPPFRRFGEDYRATGRFNDCLDRLKASLADPVGDRIVESLRIAREVGGSDLGRLLRTLSTFLREDARTRSELQARQSWTVNGARVAVAAPWLVLGFMSFQPDVVSAYNSFAGFLVLAGGGFACVLAYWLMVRIGRLPDEERVLR